MFKVFHFLALSTKRIPQTDIKESLLVYLILTKFELVLLLSSSGIGRKTARAQQLAKMVNKMIISKVLDEEAQDQVKDL